MLIRIEDQPANVERLKICSTCSGVYGPWLQTEGGMSRTAGTEYIQQCVCGKPKEDTASGKKEISWPGFDFNEYATLCYCCGLVPLPSGSKWSIWFCKWCKAHVWDLNEQHGAAVIPIGRHSLMNGVFFDKAKTQTRAVQQFSSDLLQLFGQMEPLREWARSIVAKNVGFVEPGGADPSFERYVAVTQWFAESNVDWSHVRNFVPMSRFQAFESMVAFIRKRLEEKRPSGQRKPASR